MSFDEFTSDDDDRRETAEPPFGRHAAALQSGKLGTSKAGNRMVILEWQTVDFAHWWSSFHVTTGNARHFTKRMLEGLGVDLEECKRPTDDQSWDAVVAAVNALSGTVYTVLIQAGGGDFKNTSVVEKLDNVQPELPVDTSDFVPQKSSGLFDDDDDVPF